MKKRGYFNLIDLIKDKTDDEKIESLREIYYKDETNYLVIFHLLINLAKKEKYKERAKELLLLLANHYSEKHVYFALGKIELNDYNLEKAKEYFDLSLKCSPKDKFSLFEMARVNTALKEYEEAEEYYYQILSLPGKPDIYALIELSKLKLEQKKNDEAKYFLERALIYLRKEKNYNPKTENYITLFIGKCEKLNGNTFDARDKFKEILTRNPKDKFALLELAKLEIEENNFGLAKFYLKRILKNYPKDKHALYEMAKLCLVLGDYEESDKYFEIVKPMFNQKNKLDLAFTLFKLAENEIEKQEYSKAEKIYQTAIKHSDLIIAYSELAKFEHERLNFEKAEEYLKIGYEKGYSRAILDELGRSELRKGNYEQALKYYMEIKEEDRTIYEYIYFITLYLKLNDIDNALYYFLKLQNFENKENVSDNLIERIDNYIKYRLNILEEDENSKFVFRKQLLNYDEGLVIEHASKYFENDKVEEILRMLKEKLEESVPINSYGSSDFYLVKLDEPVFGINGRLHEYIGATTIINSNNILYFYPAHEEEQYVGKKIKTISKRKN